jgi:hypothetical protein
MDSDTVVFKDKLYHITEPEGWPRFYPADDLSESSLLSDNQHAPWRPSTSLSRASNEVSPFQRPSSDIFRAPPGIQYEIYVPWPGKKESGIHEVLWHVTTRNFFAILCGSSAIIGTTWFEAFSTVLKRIRSCPGYLAEGSSHVDWIVRYIVRNRFDDVRNNPSYAASLLAFSELPDVQWREGYIEAFVHCVGMYNLGQLDDIVEWQYITPHTQIFIRNASMEMEDRIHRAQVWLTSFDLTEMWPANSAPPSSGRGCFDRLRRWLCSYYERVFRHWPPSTEKGDQTWLSFQVVQRLKNDFHTLYDYLVDRDIMFEAYQHRLGHKWRIVNKSDRMFRPDSFDMPLTDILVAFDDRNNFPHIPYPFPRTPDPIPVQSKAKFAFRKTASPGKIQAESRKKARAYAEASNVYSLRNQFAKSDLVMSFIGFEQSDMLDNIDPFEARRGRWVLIYGILQILATVSVDSPHLRYKKDSLYHLSPQMKGVVPWASVESPPEKQAEHEDSHCWTVPSTWPQTTSKVRSAKYQPIIWDGFGDGRGRWEHTDEATQENEPDQMAGCIANEDMELGPANMELEPTRMESESTYMELESTHMELASTHMELASTHMELKPANLEWEPANKVQGAERGFERAQHWVDTNGEIRADGFLQGANGRVNSKSIGKVPNQCIEESPSEVPVVKRRQMKVLPDAPIDFHFPDDW